MIGGLGAVGNGLFTGVAFVGPFDALVAIGPGRAERRRAAGLPAWPWPAIPTASWPACGIAGRLVVRTRSRAVSRCSPARGCVGTAAHRRHQRVGLLRRRAASCCTGRDAQVRDAAGQAGGDRRPGRVVGRAAPLASGGPGGAGPWRRCEVSGRDGRLRRPRALDGVALSAEPGRVTGLIGPNGAGKSTLFDVVSGLRRPVVGPGVARRPGRHPAGPGAPVPARAGPHVPAARAVRPAQRARQPAGRRRSSGRTARRRRRWSPRSSTGSASPTSPTARRDALPTGIGRLVEVARALAVQPEGAAARRAGRRAGLRGDRTVRARSCARLADAGTAVVLVEHDMALVMDVCDEVSRPRPRKDHRGRPAGGDPPRREPSSPPTWGKHDARCSTARRPRGVRRDHRPARRRPECRRRPGGGPARPERRRQDDHAEGRRRRPPGRRSGQLLLGGRDVTGVAPARPGPRRRLPDPGGPRRVPEPVGPRQPADDDLHRPLAAPRSRRSRSRRFPALGQRRVAGGRHAVRRRAADARPRPRAWPPTRRSCCSTNCRWGWRR